MVPTESIVLVTGASSGIGREIAVALSQSVRLVLSGRAMAKLEETRRACSNPDRHLIWPCDLSTPAGIEPALKAFLEQNPVAIHGLVYVAGVFKGGPLRLISAADAFDLMSVNFFSAAELSRLLLKATLNDKHLKQIVFISSVASLRGVRGFQYYSASKGALDSFMRSLALEVAPHVRVNSVLPGAVHTESANSEMLERAKAVHPLGVGQPADVANAVRFLLSEEARWVTGQQMVVDGGWSCGK